MLKLSKVVATVGRFLTSRKESVVNRKGIVLITGASTGIGRHAAEYIARKHKDLVVLAGVRKESDALSIANMNQNNLRPWFIDVSSKDSCCDAIEKVREIMSAEKLPLVALVNNAGVGAGLPAEFHEMKDVKSMFATNVFGVMHLTQLALPHLRDSKGRIVMISSVGGFMSFPLRSIYSASKHAVEGYAACLRGEVAHFDMSVSIIQPAYIKSAIDGKIAAKSPKEDEIKQLYGQYYSQAVADNMAYELAHASDPLVTSLVIEDAIMSKYPKTKYPVAMAKGLTAGQLYWLHRLLPDRLVDTLMNPKMLENDKK